MRHVQPISRVCVAPRPAASIVLVQRWIDVAAGIFDAVASFAAAFQELSDLFSKSDNFDN